MGASGVSDEYTPPRLSRLLHALPHINVTLHRVNDTFAPDSPVYLEATRWNIYSLETAPIETLHIPRLAPLSCFHVMCIASRQALFPRHILAHWWKRRLSVANPHCSLLGSLGILGSIPGAWLILTLTVLLIYLLTRCCDRKQRPPRSITALKVSVPGKQDVVKL
ncbi:hypothetical protein MSG28_004328 [Choristoneura fumiferana]|uniref:Uncharacterized protein n=1 Tax=Choristoneura fumiferana TaxID=7141 RepID=A0ACC0KJ04_CHOFU|nr:hypothetical protein MSG28_004328 [Choristoneura fumiferana]